MTKREVRRMESHQQVFPGESVCIYCGLDANVDDHALPYSRRNSLRAATRALVPSCIECNSLLYNSLQHTIQDRIDEAKARLRKKYKKLLDMPYWSDDELRDLGPGSMFDYIFASIFEKKLLLRRLDFNYVQWVDMGRPKDLRPKA